MCGAGEGQMGVSDDCTVSPLLMGPARVLQARLQTSSYQGPVFAVTPDGSHLASAPFVALFCGPSSAVRRWLLYLGKPLCLEGGRKEKMPKPLCLEGALEGRLPLVHH